MPPNRALEGLKVLDISSQLVAPIMTKCLGDYGATVVLVESRTHPTIVRVSPPFKDNKVHPDTCYAFLSYNSSKYSIALDLAQPGGLDVLGELVTWADVVVENLTSTKMIRMRVSYEDLKMIKPSIIVISTTGFGQSGPLANSPAWGWNLFAAAGFPSFLGWPDSEPMPCPVAYSDYLSPWYGVLAVMAALEYRERTGKGQFIDMAQNEVNLHYLGPALLGHAANGLDNTLQGNSSPYGAPHGVYRCRGEDRWCAIAVFTDKEWHFLCDAMGRPQWTGDGRFTTVVGRKENEYELNRLIEEWTVGQTAEHVAETLQSLGVAAGVVQTAAEVVSQDPQIRHRGFIQTLSHPAIGPSLHVGSPGKLLKTPSQMRPAPCLGEHTEYVCREILHMDDERFIQLITSGALG